MSQQNQKNKSDLLVEIQWLTRGYEKSPSLIFDKFNFKIYKNDFYFILWRSWVGKTTLSKFLIRHLKPPKKMIFYKKEDIARFTDAEAQRYRRKIWVIYQDFKLIDRKTVQQNIAYPLELVWEDPLKIEKKVNDILYKMELMDKRDEKIPYLSWWEKQRVAIARALVAKPEFIIADEPTWNLDQDTSKRIADILIDINREWNTVLFITHDMELLEYIKTKISIKLVKL